MRMTLRRNNNDVNKGDEFRFARSERILITLIVLLVLCMTYVVLSPNSTIGGSRNEQRLADIHAIASAVHRYIHDKITPSLSIGGSDTEICAMRATNCNGKVDLRPLMVYSRYLSKVPQDPQCATLCSSNGSGYVISENSKGLITVSARFSEQNKLLSAVQ